MLSELLPEEKRRLHDLEQKYLLFEKESSQIQSNKEMSSVDASDITMGLTEMNFRLNELDKLVQKEPKAKRDDFKRRVNHLRATFNHISNSMKSLVGRKDRTSYDSQKKELFANAVMNNSTGDLDLELAESGSLDRSNSMMNEYIAVGRETLSELFAQKERLKGVQRKVFDILNYLGIANTIMKAVEKREVVDKWIVYIGMIFILFLIIFLWYYYGR